MIFKVLTYDRIPFASPVMHGWDQRFNEKSGGWDTIFDNYGPSVRVGDWVRRNIPLPVEEEGTVWNRLPPGHRFRKSSDVRWCPIKMHFWNDLPDNYLITTDMIVFRGVREAPIPQAEEVTEKPIPDSPVPDDLNVDRNFRWHPPGPQQIERYGEIRGRARRFARFLTETCSDNRELREALKNLESCVMWANASIARTPESEEKS